MAMSGSPAASRACGARSRRFGASASKTLARVLAGLHRRGLVHRDIKPSNVILVGGVPKLADIGLVSPVASARTLIGTEGYVPPEGPGAPSADVFALGKVLNELATGLDRQEFPQLPTELNRLPDHRTLLALNRINLRACDPLPKQRYRDGAALLADLSALQAGSSPREGRVGRSLWISGATVALAGNKDRAIAGIAEALKRLGLVNVWELRFDPYFTKLRCDPRFEALIADQRNDEPLF